MAKKRSRYRTLFVYDYEVLVGLRPEDNDELTFRLAKPSDEFFRASGVHDGSHVVVKNPSAQPIDRRVLEGAAAVAAWYSPFRNEASVEVHHCRVRNVRKKAGAPAGEIRVYGFKKKFVAPSLDSCTGTPAAIEDPEREPD